MLVFVEGGKPENPEKNARSKDENQQQTQPTCDAGSANPLIELGPHWYEESARTTAPSLLPSKTAPSLLPSKINHFPMDNRPYSYSRYWTGTTTIVRSVGTITKLSPSLPPPLLNVELPNILHRQSLATMGSTLKGGRGARKMFVCTIEKV